MDARAISAYDSKTDAKYFHRERFSGWGGNRIFFGMHVLLSSHRYSTVVLGHINLAMVGWLVKKLRPSVRLVLVIHGIEAWKKLDGVKLDVLRASDLILSVSEFTKSKIVEFNAIDPNKIKIFPNTIDPYFVFPKRFEKPKYLLDRYKINPFDNILLTVTRLSTSEKYKGYDHVLDALKDERLRKKPIKYLLCGKADEQEQVRINWEIEKRGLENVVLLVGFVDEKELTDHYLLADLFVMPSKKEGFGIVFIEALACGLRVIAGSKDGSKEALMGGQLGKLIDPDSVEELTTALLESLDSHEHDNALELRAKMISNFGFQAYKERTRKYLTGL